jgi:hypothetical protein
MAQRGGVNVLSGAPYGYRYVKKVDTASVFYEIVETKPKWRAWYVKYIRSRDSASMR